MSISTFSISLSLFVLSGLIDVLRSQAYSDFTTAKCSPAESSVKEPVESRVTGKLSKNSRKKADIEEVEKVDCGKKGCANCAELYLAGAFTSGVYTVDVISDTTILNIKVYCDMITNGGGWTVIQRRGYFGVPYVKFNRTWKDYVNGFGDLSKEFWLGNQYIHLLTIDNNISLHIDLSDFHGNYSYALYEGFRISDEKEDYKLTVARYKGGNMGDRISYHSNERFQTYDHGDVQKCAEKCKAGWWFKREGQCYHANLNGVFTDGASYGDLTRYVWQTEPGPFGFSLRWGQMKIRPGAFRYWS